MKRALAFSALLAATVFVAGQALSQPKDVGAHGFKPLGTILSAVACNASAGTRTWTATAGQGAGFGVAAFHFVFDYTAGGSAVAWSCEGSLNNGSTFAPLQSCDVATGVCTSSDSSWSKATGSADDAWLWRVDFLGMPDIKCTFSCTAGGATDTVTVYGMLSEL